MLVLIAFSPTQADNIELLNKIDSLGRNLQLFDGCYLLETSSDADCIAKKLRPFFAPFEKLIVTYLYRGHCAGHLPDVPKEFVRKNISPVCPPIK